MGGIPSFLQRSSLKRTLTEHPQFPDGAATFVDWADAAAAGAGLCITAPIPAGPSASRVLGVIALRFRAPGAHHPEVAPLPPRRGGLGRLNGGDGCADEAPLAQVAAYRSSALPVGYEFALLSAPRLFVFPLMCSVHTFFGQCLCSSRASHAFCPIVHVSRARCLSHRARCRGGRGDTRAAGARLGGALSHAFERRIPGS